MPNCKKCNDTGVWETGNNDLPCDECGAGNSALFNVAGRGLVTGGELRKEFEEQKKRPLPDYLK